MALQTLTYSALIPGGVDPTTLSYALVAVPSLGPPTLNESRPESFGEPNYDSLLFYKQLLDALRPTFNDVAWVVTIATFGDDNQTMTFVYHDTDSVTPIRFADDAGHYQQWLAALGGSAESRPVTFTFNASQSGRSSAIHLDMLATDPASFMTQSAPSSWTARAQAGPKQLLLDAALKVAGPAAVTDLDLVRTRWSELVALANFETEPGATEADFAAFREATGFDLPSGLRTLLSLSNGAKNAFGFRSLMSVSQIITQWTEWKQIFDDFHIQDLQSGYTSDQDRTVALYTTPHWISFVDESTGNYAAVDLIPGPAGQLGQIIYFGADEYTIRCLASDVADFLGKEIAHRQTTADPDGSWF